MRYWLAGTLALLAASFAVVSPAAAGIDKEYRKPADKKSWGELLLDFVDHPGFGKSYALVVGISRFDDFSALPTANDPLRMRDFLINEAGFDYVHVLTDDKATKARIEELMVDVLPAMIHDNDQFLFYWSGHGTQRRNALGGQVGYLPLASSPNGLYATMISMGDIQRWDEVLDAKQALFLLDACFSGLAGSASKSDHRELQINQLDKPAHHLVSAGTAGEETIAGDRWGGSIFTDAVLRAVRGEADAETVYPKDGVVSLSELIGYVKIRVANEAPAVGWTRPITPQPYKLRESPGEFFFLTAERKLAKLESAGVQYQGRFENGVPVVAKGDVLSPACDRDSDRLFWDAIKTETAPGYFEAYLKRVERGELCGLFADIARLKVAAPFASEPASSAQKAPIDACDLLAASPYDRNRVAPGVELRVLDPEPAIAACSAAASTYPDEARFQYQYGRALEMAGRYAEALVRYRRGAEQAYAAAENNLGSLYQQGQGVAQDDAQAAAWYRKAADRGLAAAEHNLGWMYKQGRGVAQDDAQAVAWYRKAAEQGYAGAQYNLGWMYQEGRGVAQDEAQAAAWYRKAAEQGNADAQYGLGWVYETGRGAPRDGAQAATWYRKAAEQGNENAIAVLTRLGEPVPTRSNSR